MGGAREEQILSIVGLLAPGTPIGVVGEAGIGTSSVLGAAAAMVGGPVVRSGGLRSLQQVPFIPLNRALGADVGGDPAVLPDLVDRRVGHGVLVIDDLQWADGGTLAALATVAARVRVLAGIRRGDEGEVEARAALAAAGGAILRLAPLDDVDCVAVVRAARPDLGPDAVDALVRNSAGNPLVLHQLLVGGEVSTTLADALRASVDGCGELSRHVLAVLAGRDDGLPVAAVGGPLDELVAAELVTIRDEQVFLRHRLIGEAVAAALDAPGRRAVHQHLATLARAPGDRARHLADAGDLELALPFALEAASGSGAGERADHLELAARCCAGVDRVRILVDAADASLEARDVVRARALADAALAVPSTVPSPRAWAAAAEARARDGAGEEAITAAAQVGSTAPPADRARALAASALALAWPLWRPTQATAAAEQAIDLRGADPTATEHAALGVARLVSGDPRWREEDWCLGPTTRAFGALLSGAAERPPAAGGAGRAVDRDLLDVIVALHATGDCDGVSARLHRLLEQVERPIDREVARAHLAVALADSGRTSAAADVATAGLRADPSPAGRALLIWALTEAELAGSRLTKARAAAAQVDRSAPSPAATLSVLAGTWAAMGAPGGRVAPPPPLPPAPWPGLRAAELELSALALAETGPPAAVEAAFMVAAAAWEGWHRRGDLPCRWAAADAARSVGTGEGAVERLRAVEEAASRLGQRPLVARVRASLRAAGVRTRPSRGKGRGSLSAREVEVLELVRLGFTTIEAAQSLGVAASTVETQIESAMRKLDARTRLQAAALVAELRP